MAARARPDPEVSCMMLSSSLLPGSYGSFAAPVQAFARAAAFAALLMLPAVALAADPPVKIVAFGDSLTAGNGLSAKDAFPAKLEKALKAKGLVVEIANAGVSGDTA